MARIRSIKPEFWTSDQIVECSRDARLLFIGMWNFADDYGVIPAKPKSIKMKVFPGEEDLSTDDVRRMLDELSSNGLIVEYTANGHAYFYITGWSAHQKIDRPSQKHPGPSEADDTTNRRTIDDDSTSVDPRSGGDVEGKGRDVEGSGEDGALPDESASGADAPLSQSNDANDPVVESIPLNTGKPHAVRQSDVDYYRETYPAVDVVQSLRTMRDWCNSNPSKRKTASGVKSFITRWLSKEQDRGGNASPATGGSNGRPYSRNQGAAEQAARELEQEFNHGTH